jgi:type VI secretion system FHA domain protein
MAIKLRVISDQHRELGEMRTRVFGVNGGSIGRAPDNDWILPDAKRIVSGHHCEIEYRSGTYWIKDISTNGVFINDSEEPASQTGPVELADGDRLRLGDYEIVVSVDKRTDFIPSPGEEIAAARTADSGIGAKLDVNKLFRSRDDTDSGSIPVRNAKAMKAARTVRQLTDDTDENEPPPPPGTPPEADWAMKTRPVTRQELADALARRKNRAEARDRSAPYHQQASTWTDLRSALQAFCRGAGIELGSLTPEAQTMLPLLAGQLLREAVVGLIDLQQARNKDNASAQTPTGSNPLRTSQSVEQALQRLFESYGRLAGGPVDSMREVFVEIRDHDAASSGATSAALHELLGQLAPANVADQFERGRSRALAPGQDPRPKYWEHYLEFYRVLTQGGTDGLPHQFTEMFQRAYSRAREELRNRRRGE